MLRQLDLQEIQIFPDQQYNNPIQQKEDSINSSQELSHLNYDLDQQQAFVESKYQKYKRLRRQLHVKKINESVENKNKDLSESISSFSGSSLSSSEQEHQGSSKVKHPDGISSQTLTIIAQKFQKMKQLGDNLTQQLLTFKRIGEDHDVNPQYIQFLYSIWEKNPSIDGRIEVFPNSLNNGNDPKAIKLVPTEEMLNVERAKTIEELLTVNPLMNLNQIYLELNKMNHLKENKFGKFKQITRTIITKLINQRKFQTKFRVLHPNRNDKNIVQMRHLYCKQFLNKIKQKVTILFLDELNFNLFQAGRDCLWIKPEKQTKANQNINQQQFSLLVIFDLNGGAFFKISKICSQKYEDCEGFASLVHQALGETNENNKNSQLNKKLVLIMDPVIIHNTVKQKRLKQLTKGKIMFLPLFSPQLNPIQQWFLKLRQRIRKNVYINSHQLCQGIHTILKEYQTFNFMELINQAIGQAIRGFEKSRF